MRERLQAWHNKVLEKWKGLTKSQKIKVTAIAGTVLVALILTLVFTLRTVWVPTFDRTDAASAAAIQEVLADEGIRARYDESSATVYVPQQDAGRARLTAQRSDILRDTGLTWHEVFDMAGMGISANMQHNMAVQALQTSIEQMLVATGVVSFADVILSVPNTPMLIRPITPSSAAVTIGTGRFTPEEGRSVAIMTMRAVPGLTLDTVTVMDTDLNILFDGGEMIGGGGGANAAAIMEAGARHEIVRNIRIAFPMASDVHAAVNVVSDPATTIMEFLEHTNPYSEDSQSGLISHQSWHDIVAMIFGDGAAFEPGAFPNGFPGSAPLLGEQLEGVMTMLLDEQGFRNYLYNTLHTLRNIPAGSLLRDQFSGTITLVYDVFHDRSNMVLREIIDDSERAWADHVAETGNFNQIELEDAELAQRLAAASNATGIPLANLSLAVYEMHHFIDFPPTAPLPLAQIILLALTVIFIAFLAFGLIRRSQPQSIDDIEPELSVEDLLVSSQLEDAMDAEMSESQRLAQIRHEQDSAVKAQIDKFATEKPESVAQLLRNWINEDWE